MALSLWPVLLIVGVVGINFTFWGLIGLVRVIDGRLRQQGSALGRVDDEAVPLPVEVAVLVPAHNEELVLAKTLRSALRVLPARNIHVVSDGSTDGTARVARGLGAQVIELTLARGKAAALCEGIRAFDLLSRYKVVLFLDADSAIDKEYLTNGLRLFSEPDVAAVAPYATTEWPGRDRSLWTRYLIAYRERVYVLTQLLQKYGQTGKYANLTYIVPGFAGMYRTGALAQIDIEVPGLVIEDFNMTFELHHKRLGRVAFDPSVFAYTQDPDNLRDYVKQLKRWLTGFWQTIKRHGFWPSLFSASVAVTALELVGASLFLISLPFVLVLIGLQTLVPASLPHPVASAATLVAHDLSFGRLFWFVFVPDYALSCWVGAVRGRFSYVVFGLLFLPMRVLDAVLALWSIPLGLRRSASQWVSPARRGAASHVTPSRCD